MEADTGEKTALRPGTPIGPALRTIATGILAEARAIISDPQRSSDDAVHKFRRALKQWRALMRLLQPLLGDAQRWRREARDHARALGTARDGQSALNAFEDIVKRDLSLSPRLIGTIRGRLQAVRDREEKAVLTDASRETVIAWLDATAAAVAACPLETIDFNAIAERLAAGYRTARRLIPADWSLASAADRHELRQRAVEHRYQMELIEPLWPRFGRMWTEEAERLRDRLGGGQDLEVLERLAAPHQPLAHWRSRLAPACHKRKVELSARAARIAARLFAERPKAFRRRLEALWENGRY